MIAREINPMTGSHRGSDSKMQLRSRNRFHPGTSPDVCSVEALIECNIIFPPRKNRHVVQKTTPTIVAVQFDFGSLFPPFARNALPRTAEARTSQTRL